MKKFKRVFSIILVLTMILTIFPITISADPTGDVAVKFVESKVIDRTGDGAAIYRLVFSAKVPGSIKILSAFLSYDNTKIIPVVRQAPYGDITPVNESTTSNPTPFSIMAADEWGDPFSSPGILCRILNDRTAYSYGVSSMSCIVSNGTYVDMFAFHYRLAPGVTQANLNSETFKIEVYTDGSGFVDSTRQGIMLDEYTIDGNDKINSHMYGDSTGKNEILITKEYANSTVNPPQPDVVLPNFSSTTNTMTYGDLDDEPLTVTSTTPGATVAYTSGNTAVATVDNTTGVVTTVGAGTAVITATASATGYNSKSVSYTLTVNRKPITITVDAVSIKYGQPIPTFTASGSGFVSPDTIATLTIPLATTATSASPVGSYDVTSTGTGNNGNYIVTLDGTGKFTIDQATATSITDTFAVITKTAYEAKDWATVGAISADLLPNEVNVALDGSSTVTGKLGVTWATDTTYNAKEAVYAFTGTLTGNANIATSLTGPSATITITPVNAPIAITLDPKSIKNGSVDADDESATKVDELVTAGVLPATGSTTIADGGDFNLTFGINWTVGTTINTTIDSGSKTVTFTGAVTSYTNAPAWLTTTLPVTVSIAVTAQDKVPVDDKITFTAADATYTGNPVTREGATISGVELGTGAVWTYTYYISGQPTPLAGKPVDAGNYEVVAKYEDSLNMGSKSAAFKIDKANQTAPAAPALSAKSAVSVTLVEAADTEYRLGTDGEWQAGNEFDGLTPNTAYTFYARLKADDNHNASPESAALNVTTDKSALTGTVTITGTAKFDQTLTAVTTALASDPAGELGTLSYQWKRGTTNITGATASTYKLVAADIGSEITVAVTAANCLGEVVSAPTVNIAKADEASLSGKVSGSYAVAADGETFTYTVTPITGAKYSEDGTTWQDSNVFTGFVADDVVTFYAMIPSRNNLTYNDGAPGDTGVVTFARIAPANPTLNYTIEGDTVTITPVAGALYQFDSDKDDPRDWDVDNTYTFASGAILTLYIKLYETDVYTESAVISVTVDTSLPTPAAPAIEMKFTPDLIALKYTVEIEEVDGAEYSFDGITFSAANSKIANPGDTVTGYIRLAAVATANASGVASSKVTLPLFTAEIPAANPNGGTFTTSQSVELTTSTANADIYYTLDGSAPNIGSTKYTAAIELTDTTTIKAFAVKAGMLDSAVLTVTFTKSTSKPPVDPGTGGGGGYIPPSSGGGTDSGAATTPTTPDTTANPDTIPASGGVKVPVKWDKKNQGEAQLLLTNSSVNELIKGAAGSEVIFDLSGAAGATKVAFEAGAAKMIADAGLSLTIKLPNAEFTFDKDALAALYAAGKNAASLITIEATKINMKDLKGMQAAQVKGYETVLNIDVFVGGVKTDIPMKVSIPYKLKENEKAGGVNMWKLSADGGTLTNLKGVYNEKTGLVSADIKTQSIFVAGYDPVALWENKFTDIKDTEWYFGAVAYANYYGLMKGYGEGIFAPNDSMSRAMFVTVLWNMENNPKVSGAAKFSDISEGDWYYDAIAWAVKNKIIKGLADGSFAPNEPITRQQMAASLFNYSEYKDYSIPANRDLVIFKDADKIDDWAAVAVSELSKAGIINGMGDGEFAPLQTATRAQVSQIFMNFMRFAADN